MEDNCLDCLYANYPESWSFFKELTGNDYFKCDHPNSPYHGEIVDEFKSCRLFVNEKDYFRNKDIREKIEKLKRK